MANGNADLIREMREIVKDGKDIPPEMRDRLMFSALLDIYEQIEKFKPVLVFYQVGLFFASGIGISVLGFIGALLTGQIELVFK